MRQAHIQTNIRTISQFAEKFLVCLALAQDSFNFAHEKLGMFQFFSLLLLC